MITNEQIEKMVEKQKKIPLMRRAMGLDLPDIPKEEHDAWVEYYMKERFHFAFMETEEFVNLLSEQIKLDSIQ